MALARFHFHPLLRPLLGRRIRSDPFLYQFNDQPSVKDAIEACGVPHTEIDVILVNGQSVPFDRRLQDGNIVKIVPFGVLSDQNGMVPLSPPPPDPATFILDVHLGRLARRLRLLGLDCSYRNDCDDRSLIGTALAEGRIILTRDRGILKHAAVQQGMLVRSGFLDDQVLQVMRRYRQSLRLSPFRRCPDCNGKLYPVVKDTIRHRLLPGTERDFDLFQQCAGCNKLYWEGSHYLRIKDWLGTIRARMEGTDGVMTGWPQS
ncbi:MAG: Mut7-C RNAse domain-containing protein [Desulfuromonadales bacterium]|nr:Mut7-C RNAse domain-containing protein [Desulfuromonadales bacterium]